MGTDTPGYDLANCMWKNAARTSCNWCDDGFFKQPATSSAASGSNAYTNCGNCNFYLYITYLKITLAQECQISVSMQLQLHLAVNARCSTAQLAVGQIIDATVSKTLLFITI